MRVLAFALGLLLLSERVFGGFSKQTQTCETRNAQLSKKKKKKQKEKKLKRL